MQKVRSRPHKGLLLLVDMRFQVLFHSPLGVLFTFPSRYLSSIGNCLVFRLGGWSPQIPSGFHVSGGTQDTPRAVNIFDYRAITLFCRTFQSVHLMLTSLTSKSYNPQFKNELGLAYYPFARHYSGNLVWFIFQMVLRCFTSHRLLLQPMYSVADSI
jgi:hypothetical protein